MFSLETVGIFLLGSLAIPALLFLLAYLVGRRAERARYRGERRAAWRYYASMSLLFLLAFGYTLRLSEPLTAALLKQVIVYSPMPPISTHRRLEDDITLYGSAIDVTYTEPTDHQAITTTLILAQRHTGPSCALSPAGFKANLAATGFDFSHDPAVSTEGLFTPLRPERTDKPALEEYRRVVAAHRHYCSMSWTWSLVPQHEGKLQILFAAQDVRSGHAERASYVALPVTVGRGASVGFLDRWQPYLIAFITTLGGFGLLLFKTRLQAADKNVRGIHIAADLSPHEIHLKR